MTGPAVLQQRGEPPTQAKVRPWAASTTPGDGWIEPVVPLVSFAPTEPWWERHDPYWEPELFVGSPRWRFKSTWVEAFKANGAGQLLSVQDEIPDFVNLPPGRAAHASTRGAMARLGQWHHATTGQLAAFGGFHQHHATYYLGPLFTSGLVERCRLDPHHRRGERADLLWQLRRDRPTKDWLAALPHHDWANTTLGANLLAPGAGRRHFRHNLHATELVLRTFETIPEIVSAIGEPLSDPALLLPPDHPATPTKRTGWRGDATMIRADGLRIVFEITMGTAEYSTREKMRRWGRLLGQYSLNESGVVVVFLNSDLDRHEAAARSLRRCHADAISADGLGTPGRPSPAVTVQRARQQIMLASWREWFPNFQVIAERFLSLPAAYTRDGEQWAYTRLADTDATPFSPLAPALFADAVHQVPLGHHHPAWAGGPIGSTFT